MPKQKTKKSAARRFRVTKNGKLLHFKTGRRHLKHSKSKCQKGKYKKTIELKGRIAKKIKKVIGKTK